jgi:mannose-1-phosphate guanylyltransferase
MPRQKLYPVILSGGSGTRLWPLSRQQSPKQFINLVDDHNLLQDTVARLLPIGNIESVTVVCNEDHRFQVAESLRGLQDKEGNVKRTAHIILEPIARNTAPAIALAAFDLIDKGKDAIMLVLSADHHIKHSVPFLDAVQLGMGYAEQSKIVTFGICPDKPHTGYGYIKKGKITGTAFVVDSFVEKPSLKVAEAYLHSRDYLWNSGMFMMKASVYLKSLKAFDAETYQACFKAYEGRHTDLDFIRVDKEAFSDAKSESVDYAILEKSKDLVVLPLKDSGWSDVGSWGELFELKEKNMDGNIIDGDVLTENVKNCYLHSHDRLLAAVGIQDLIVVETADAILVSHKDKTQEVKKIVIQLSKKNRDELRQHKKIYAPWGYREMLVKSERFIVQKILMEVGQKSALQMHYHKIKHFTILLGTAEVTLDGESKIFAENSSIMIGIGVRHQLINCGKVPLRLIEVQSGSYLGDDDIVRFEEDK